MKIHLKLAAALLACAAMAPAQALAQDLSATISCLRGHVPAGDYAEMGQKLEELFGDRRGGVKLESSIGNVKLRVTDQFGVSVCQQTANNTTQCALRLDLGYVDIFNITIDNTDNAQASDYKACSY